MMYDAKHLVICVYVFLITPLLSGAVGIAGLSYVFPASVLE